MKKIEVEIVGISSLLMHSAKAMLQQGVTKNPTKEYDHKIEAEKVAYRTAKGYLHVPNVCLKACFVNGARWKKLGRISAKSVIAGSTRIEPKEVLLLNSKNKPFKDYVIDLRTVVIQGRDRIVRSRPRIDKWKLRFDIIYNEEIIKGKEGTNLLKKTLEDAGQTIGILDFRPAKSGDCGTFKVTKWKVI